MKLKIQELLEYNYISNKDLIIKSVLEFNHLDEKCVQIINHILNANQVWNARILNENTFGVWQMNDFSQWININEVNYEKSLFVLNNFDLKSIIKYQTSQGATFENSIEDILFHVINHSTYHRGQIAMLFRKNEIEPLVSDYIIYKRK